MQVTFLKILAASSIIFSAYFNQAIAISNKCEDLIDDTVLANFRPLNNFFHENLEIKAIRFVEDPIFRNKLTKKTPEFREAMRRLLLFFSNTVNENSSNKLSVEKGEMYFGWRLPNGTSVEFKYEIDRRTDQSRFILTKIEFRKKNMGEIEITDEALDEQLKHFNIDGLLLAKKYGESDSEYTLIKKKQLPKITNNNENKFNPDDLKTDTDALTINDINQITANTKNSKLTDFLPQTEIPLPFVIEGEILTEFVELAEILQDLDRPTVRKYAENGQLGRLRLKGYNSYLLGNAEKVFFKQAMKQIAFKGPMVAIIFLLIKLNDIQQDLADLDDPDLDSVLVSQEMSEFLNTFFDTIDSSENWHNSKLYSQLKKEIKINLNQNMNLITKSTEQLINFYLKKEKHKTDIRYYRANKDFSKVQKISSIDFPDKSEANADMEHILIHFSEQNIIVLISRSYSKVNPAVMNFQSHMVIKASKVPLLYEGLLELAVPTVTQASSSN